MATNDRLKYLFQTYLAKTYTPGEREELFGYIRQAEYDNDLRDLIEETWNGHILLHEQEEQDADTLFQKILATAGRTRPSVIRIWKWVAAACIIIAIAVVGILTNNHKPTPRPVATTHDVAAPKETRAVITLANGSKVYLDSVDNGTIAQENNVNVVKTEDGKVVYQSVNASTPLSMTYNTLSNPRGSKVIDMQLSDGSHVWLNAGSSIKYPVAFIGKERIVEITGEAYFDVKHNAKQPFKVHLPNGSIVEDIGTSFNVNAYADEDNIKTTLIEGTIAVSLSGVEGKANRKILKPGQQAIVNSSKADGRILPDVLSMTNPAIEVQTANVNEVTAWRDNKFYFDGADIKTIARQLARWYDVDVEIKDNITNHFTGIISRSVNVSRVFEMLEQTGAVHFSVEGKKIIVKK